MTRCPPCRWTPSEDARLRALRALTPSYAKMAAALGRTVPQVGYRLAVLGLTAPKAPDWTTPDENRIRAMLDAHESYATIAKALGRGERALRSHAAKLRLAATRSNGRSIHATAALLGVDGHAVARWADAGWLTAHTTALLYCRGACRLVEDDDLLAFLEDEAHWHLWEPSRITDRELAEWATERRRGLTFLTTAEVGDILCCTHYRVNQLIREGRLKAVRNGGANWRVRSDWVRMPVERPKWKGPPWTDAQKAFVRAWWGKRTAVWIAGQLGRCDAGVHAAARRMGLPRLGRGQWKKQRGRVG